MRLQKVREGAAVVLKLWKRNPSKNGSKSHGQWWTKCPRQVWSFADWSPVTICDSREKLNPCNNGSHQRMVDSILCSDWQKRVWVLSLSSVFYGLTPRGSMRQADDNCFNFVWEFFLFLAIVQTTKTSWWGRDVAARRSNIKGRVTAKSLVYELE